MYKFDLSNKKYENFRNNEKHDKQSQANVYHPQFRHVCHCIDILSTSNLSHPAHRTDFTHHDFCIISQLNESLKFRLHYFSSFLMKNSFLAFLCYHFFLPWRLKINIVEFFHNNPFPRVHKVYFCSEEFSRRLQTNFPLVVNRYTQF